MEHYNSLKYKSIIGVMILFCTVSCQQKFESNPLIKPSIYMKEAANNPITKDFKMSDEIQFIDYYANYGGVEKLNQDAQLEFIIDKNLVNSFNNQNGTSFLPIPDGCISMDETAVIPKGQFSTKTLHLGIKTYGCLEMSVKYLVPLKVISRHDRIKTVNDLEVTYYILQARFFDTEVGMPQAKEYPNFLQLPFQSEPVKIQVNVEAKGDDIATNINVLFDIDERLVAKFNQENNTDYPFMPEGSLRFLNDKGTIEKGKTNMNPFEIEIKTSNLIMGMSYLLPVKIKDVDADASFGNRLLLNEDSITYFLIRASIPVSPNENYEDYTRSNWTATADDFQPGLPPNNAFDGNPETLWHTHFDPASAILPYPHWLLIDMGEQKVIHGFYYFPREHEMWGAGGQSCPKDIRIDISADGINWEKAGTYTLENILKRQEFRFSTAYESQFFKITILNSYGDIEFTHIAEIGTF